jgi:polyhydroxyalkanoate synthesis regulator phasin
MTLDEINQSLANLATSGDATFANAAQFVQQVVQQAQAGQMSPSEVKETLADVQKQLEIIQEMSQLAYKEQLNTILNGLIDIAGAM